MSKPSSGHFSGVTSQNIHNDGYSSQKQTDIISERVKHLDLRPHPTKHKQLSERKKKKIREKINKRTATKEEYKHKRWDDRFKARKKQGVENFWEQERERLLSGKKGTRNWTSQQYNDIINKHKPKYKNRTMEGHHTYSSSQFPHLANKGEVIYPATHYEHSKRWHGGNWRKSKPGNPFKNIKEEF